MTDRERSKQFLEILDHLEAAILISEKIGLTVLCCALATIGAEITAAAITATAPPGDKPETPGAVN
jgi:hypothetical protein